MRYILLSLIIVFYLSPKFSRGQKVGKQITITSTTTEKRIALVIGNKDYYRPDAKLINPVNDADDVQSVLKKLGFEVIKVTNVDRVRFEAIVDEFVKKLPTYDVGLFYYSGHGMAYQGENFLLPVDTDLTYETQVRSQCVSLRRVLDGMEGSAIKVNIALLDACRNNPFKKNWNRSIMPNGLVIPNNPRGSIVVFATREGGVADDNPRERNGLFTSELLKHISLPDIGLRSIIDRTTEGVENRSMGRQIPGRYDELRGDFVFVKSKETTSTTQGAISSPIVTPFSPNSLSHVESGRVKDMYPAPKMVYVEGGAFQMGSNEYSNEKPKHLKSVGNFWISQTEITVGDYLLFCESTNSHWPEWLKANSIYNIETGSDKFFFERGYSRQAKNLPIIGINWFDACAYTDWLTRKVNLKFRLPNETEWEYAAMGGRLSSGFEYSGGDQVLEVAWTAQNTNGYPQLVAQRKKNELGLYDMSGNVWEWCIDSFKRYTEESVSGNSSNKVLRGGSCNSATVGARIKFRLMDSPLSLFELYGFRIVAEIP